MPNFATSEQVLEWVKQTLFELYGSKVFPDDYLSDEDVSVLLRKMQDDNVDESLLDGKREADYCDWVKYTRELEFLQGILITLDPNNSKKVWNHGPNGLSYSQTSWLNSVANCIPSRSERFAWYKEFSLLKEEAEMVYDACRSSWRGSNYERIFKEGKIPTKSTWNRTISNKYISRALEEIKKAPAFSFGDIITLRTPWKRKIDKAKYWSDFGTDRNEIKFLKEMEYAMVVTHKTDSGPHAVKGGKKLVILTNEGALLETQERFMKKVKGK